MRSFTVIAVLGCIATLGACGFDSDTVAPDRNDGKDVLGGSGVGNGGDPLRTTFEKSRGVATAKIGAMTTCGYAKEVGSDIQKWLSENREQLQGDVKASPHSWLEESEQKTCARTKREEKAEITLAFDKCRDLITNEEIAAEVLIHESVHHFGIADETFADRVARAVLSSSDKKNCPTLYEDASEDVFHGTNGPASMSTGTGSTVICSDGSIASVSLGGRGAAKCVNGRASASGPGATVICSDGTMASTSLGEVGSVSCQSSESETERRRRPRRR